jgi:hypothetical protein
LHREGACLSVDTPGFISSRRTLVGGECASAGTPSQAQIDDDRVAPQRRHDAMLTRPRVHPSRMHSQRLRCQAHHANTDCAKGGLTDADALAPACGCDNRLVGDRPNKWATRINDTANASGSHQSSSAAANNAPTPTSTLKPCSPDARSGLIDRNRHHTRDIGSGDTNGDTGHSYRTGDRNNRAVKINTDKKTAGDDDGPG